MNVAILFLDQIFRAESVSDPVRCFVFQGRLEEPTISKFLNRSLFFETLKGIRYFGTINLLSSVESSVCNADS